MVTTGSESVAGVRIEEEASDPISDPSEDLENEREPRGVSISKRGRSFGRKKVSKF